MQFNLLGEVDLRKALVFLNKELYKGSPLLSVIQESVFSCGWCKERFTSAAPAWFRR